jgi:hypothetical protein
MSDVLWNIVVVISVCYTVIQFFISLTFHTVKRWKWFNSGPKQRLWVTYKLLMGKADHIVPDYRKQLADNTALAFVDPFAFVRQSLGAERFGETTRYKALEALKQHRCCVILGDSGFGKSTLLEYLERRCARDSAWWGDSHPIPIRLDPRFICEHGLDEAIIERFKDVGFYITKRLLQTVRTQAGFLLLIDNVDQLTDSQRRLLSSRLTEGMETTHQSGGLIIAVAAEHVDRSSRTMPLLQQLRVVELRELDDRQVEQLIRASANSAQQQAEVEEFILDCRKIAKLMRIPLLLDRLLEMHRSDSTLAPLKSWQAFASYAAETRLEQPALSDDRYREIRSHHKIEALMALASLFYADGTPAPGTKEFREVEDAIRKALNCETAFACAIRDELCAARFLESFEDGAYYAFSNRYLRDYFAARYFLQNEEGLYEHYLRAGTGLANVLHFWCGMAKQPSLMIKRVRARDPVLAISLLSEVADPPGKLAHETLHAVKGRIAALAFPDAESSPTTVQAYKQEVEYIGDALGNCIRLLSKTGAPLGTIVFEHLEGKVRDLDVQSSAFHIAIVALARSYDMKAAAVLFDCYKRLEQKGEELTRKVYDCQDAMMVGRCYGDEDAMILTQIATGDYPKEDFGKEQMAYLAKQEADSDLDKFVGEFASVKRRIRAEFVSLGDSAVEVLHREFLANGRSPEHFRHLLQDIGTSRAKQLISELERAA